MPHNEPVPMGTRRLYNHRHWRGHPWMWSNDRTRGPLVSIRGVVDLLFEQAAERLLLGCVPSPPRAPPSLPLGQPQSAGAFLR